MRIKANVDYNDETKTNYYREFEVVETLPKIGDIYQEASDVTETIINIEQIVIDCEQPNISNYYFDYYKLTTDYYDKEFDEHSTYYYYIAIEIEYLPF